MGRESRKSTHSRTSRFVRPSLFLGLAACLFALVPGVLAILQVPMWWLSITAFYLSLTAGVCAVLAGLAALVDIRRGHGDVKGLGRAAGGISLGVLGFVLIISIVVIARAYHEVSDKRASEQRLATIGAALQSYVGKYECFPPACLLDAEGRRMHSWRVLLLPHFDDPKLKALYDRYDFSEPWDGPNNQSLVGEMPQVYHAPVDPSVGGFASYLAVESEGFIFDGAKATKMDEILDGPGQTIALVEVVNSGVNWLNPVDLNADNLNFKPDMPGGLPAVYSNGRNCVLADGNVAFLDSDRKSGEVLALFTIAGGESVFPLRVR